MLSAGYDGWKEITVGNQSQGKRGGGPEDPHRRGGLRLLALWKVNKGRVFSQKKQQAYKKVCLCVYKFYFFTSLRFCI